MTVPTRLPTSPTTRPDDDDSQLKPITSTPAPTPTSHSALRAETGNVSHSALLSKTSNTDPAMTFSTTSPANTDPATNTSTTPITLSKRATTTPTTTAYNPPRITRVSIEGVIAAFAKGRNLGDKVSGWVFVRLGFFPFFCLCIFPLPVLLLLLFLFPFLFLSSSCLRIFALGSISCIRALRGTSYCASCFRSSPCRLNIAFRRGLIRLDQTHNGISHLRDDLGFPLVRPSFIEALWQRSCRSVLFYPYDLRTTPCLRYAI